MKHRFVFTDHMCIHRLSQWLCLLLVAGWPGTVYAGTVTSSDRNHMVYAVKLEGSGITIDGRMDEKAWATARPVTGFIQHTPNDGETATERTEVRVLYDDAALYIGARMYESNPDEIAATLFRRGGNGYSDWFHVGIDSYDDRRTAFVFGVNPRGVKRDFLFYNDNNQDWNWDAVWNVAVTIDEHGWTAEFRIPFSQLRYNGNEEGGRSWGINFSRDIARRGETSFWSPVPTDSDAMVSRFGRLEGLYELPSLQRLEIMPYTSGRLDRTPGTGDHPFLNEYGTSLGLGADIKYGISSNVTITATINPDFGQVEVDPAVVNLSAFETFFSERRPFFLEGAEIFNYGFSGYINMGDEPMLFYSRRIGRPPRGSVPDEALYDDIPSQTPIAGAVKLSGKTAGGWSIGILNVLTPKLTADYMPEDGRQRSTPVEPLSNYTVLRFRRDFRDGQTVVGMTGNGVYRNLSTPDLEAILPGHAGNTGLDFEHSWSERRYRINGRFATSQVSGNAEAISRLQRASSRYYQRPDAGHLEIDSTITVFAGTLADVMTTRQKLPWVTQVRYYRISPGFEVNDLGFQKVADRNALSALQLYVRPTPQWIFRQYDIWMVSLNSWNTAGDYLFNLHGVGSNFRFRNFWGVNFEALYRFRAYDDRLTRGGPIAVNPPGVMGNINLNSDNRRDFRIWAGINYQQTEPGDRRVNHYVNLQYRPHPAVNLSFQPSLNLNRTGTQYVTTVDDSTATGTMGRRYVFADLKQQTVSASIRADWTFTPDLSLQLYVQPFVSAGSFSGFKELRRPGKYDYAVYGTDTGSIDYDGQAGRYEVQPGDDGGGASFGFDDPDFKMRSLRGNAVLRWEYRHGSTLYLVWQQSRKSYGDEGVLHHGRDFSGIFEAPSNHTFLVKFSYWLGY